MFNVFIAAKKSCFKMHNNNQGFNAEQRIYMVLVKELRNAFPTCFLEN